MTVSPVTAANGASQSAQTAGPAVDYQSFLKLLVAEMKNQDPSNPMDSTQYVAQLATFSQVEQSVQMNSKLDQMLQASAMAQADALLGHEITSADGATTGTVAEVKLTSSGLLATLTDGSQVAIGAGVTIR